MAEKAAKVEFAVQIGGQKCIDRVLEALKDVGKVDVDLKEGRVVIETDSVPWNELQRRIEATGKKAVLTGFGGAQSCVSIVDVSDHKDLRGVIRFCAIGAAPGCVIDGVVDGLSPNSSHQIRVHECGDVSRGCESVGDVYGGHVEVRTDAEGRASFRLVDETLNVEDLVGRSVVVSRPGGQQRLGCGVIARSAGIFENYKKICACDGVTLWDERDRPVAGKGRRLEN